MASRRVSVGLWLAALTVTVLLAVFQRMTGPSHPLRGTVQIGTSESVRYRLARSNEGRDELRIRIPAPEEHGGATLEWRRWPTNDPFHGHRMIDREGRLEASIPRQPAAGKVEYRILLEAGDGKISIPANQTVVARFRDSVPAVVLIPHILTMFLSMLVSTRALFEVLRPVKPQARSLVLTAMALLVVGGLMLGPLVQNYAFGAYWTGWPLGHDLTDNKTLIAFLAWLPATILAWKGSRTRIAVILGWIVMMGVFLIPHSVRGSQLDWSAVDEKTRSQVPDTR
jgi:hypothetical protein